MCSGGTAYTAVKAAELKAGQTVCVLGSGGGVGHMVTQFAAAQDFTVIGIDIGADKKETVLGSGAKHYIDLGETADLTAKVKELTGGKGANAVIVTAGSGKAYAAAPPLLAPLGTLVAVGLPPAGTAIAGTEPAQLCFLGVKIRGILVTTREDMKDALQFLANGKVKEHVRLLPFSAFPQALMDVAASRTKGRFVVDFNKD
jgi:propanol-preferring alcohol dehydrogenase